MLRPYQQEAVNIAYDYVKDSVIKVVLKMATGAGKSLVIAELARLIYEYTGQRTIITAPKAELVKQNAAKFKALGLPCSIFSATAKQKDLTHAVVFATPGTLANALDQLNEEVAIIICDECEGITAQIKAIINHFRSINPKLREVGLTATPYRTGEGFIYRVGLDGQTVPSILPHYDRLIYEINTRELIAMGYLVDVVTSPVEIRYDTGDLVKDRRGRYTPASIEKTFVGKGRRTSMIVADIVRRHQFYRACLIFCASRSHAREVMESLPPGSFRYIDGETPAQQRADLLTRFRFGRFPYLVNVDVLTVGTDLPICDHIAITRKTDSDRLLQQIIGRGLRLHPNKEHCLISDYAGNLDAFNENGRDIFDPEIKARERKDHGDVVAPCPKCGYVNTFAGRPNPERLPIGPNGTFIDLAGDEVMYEIYQGENMPAKLVPFAAHYGRRCQGYRQRGPSGHLIRCNHTWQDKKCPACGESNDIAAKFCKGCKKELVDPNRYLAKLATEVVTTPDGWKLGTVKKVRIEEYTANSGRRLILASIYVIGRTTPLSKYFDPYTTNANAFAAWEQFILEGFGDDQLTVQEVLNRRKRFKNPEVASWKQIHKSAAHPEVRLMWRLPNAPRPNR